MSRWPLPVDSRLARGRRSEELARAHLERQGFRIQAINVRFRVGELDIVAWDGPVLCFVEVRSCGSTFFGGALATINRTKQEHLLQAARWYLRRLTTQPEQVRFDAVTVDWSEASPRLELVRGAFDAGNLAERSWL